LHTISIWNWWLPKLCAWCFVDTAGVDPEILIARREGLAFQNLLVSQPILAFSVSNILVRNLLVAAVPCMWQNGVTGNVLSVKFFEFEARLFGMEKSHFELIVLDRKKRNDGRDWNRSEEHRNGTCFSMHGVD
jgi:hypothetical protein